MALRPCAPCCWRRWAPEHAQLKARGTFVEVDGIPQLAPAPRFSGTPTSIPMGPQEITAANTATALSGWFDEARIDELRRSGVID